jgi:hypothetical protein
MHRIYTNAISDVAPLLTLTNISLSTSSGRQLFHDLNMAICMAKWIDSGLA